MIYLFTHEQAAAAEQLLADARAYVGSDAVGELLETDEGIAVQLVPVWTSSAFLDLPAMIEGKQFTAPKVEIAAAEPVIESSGTL